MDSAALCAGFDAIGIDTTGPPTVDAGAASCTPLPSPALCRLPVEVLIHLLSMLPVRDLLHMRRTSRLMNDVSCHRSVWLSGLRDLISQFRLPLTTFSTNPYVTPTHTLEAIVERPLRVECALTTFDSPPSIRSSRLLGLSEGHERLVFIQLIPGGRWAVAANEAGLLSFWDLEPDCGGTEIMPIVTVQYPRGSVIEACTLEPDGKADGAVLSLSGQQTLEHLYFFDIYHLSLSSIPSLQKLGRIEGKTRMFYHALDGPAHLAAILSVNHLIIWDWKLDMWRGISNDILNLEWARSISISAVDREVSVLDSNGTIHSYPIPSLLPRSYSESPEIIEAVESAEWHTTSTVQIAGAYTSEQWRPADPGISSSPVLIYDYQPQFHLLASTRKDVPPMSFIDSAHREMFSLTITGMGAWFVTMWWYDGDLVAHFTRFPTYPLGAEHDQVTTLQGETSRKVILSSDFGEKERDWVPEWVAHSFCPISGRVCISMGNGTMRILEF
ncbi:hypothetical protein BOTBODRAFT_27578 [Botryobasidium botryosum FD-172 SS1]|uniref:F-box domain-containing protein n=1 Tax=Botryobasidium botryosum (strain FD-172 SS1) TaxID=930990 RepID=A0A067N7R5_BOTB1|nr:hypothetical protein BOTBODRAFT_27578 [Botryobasidium botryosum FD-172 SS1]